MTKGAVETRASFLPSVDSVRVARADAVFALGNAPQLHHSGAPAQQVRRIAPDLGRVVARAR